MSERTSPSNLKYHHPKFLDSIGRCVKKITWCHLFRIKIFPWSFLFVQRCPLLPPWTVDAIKDFSFIKRIKFQMKITILNDLRPIRGPLEASPTWNNSLKCLLKIYIFWTDGAILAALSNSLHFYTILTSMVLPEMALIK